MVSLVSVHAEVHSGSTDGTTGLVFAFHLTDSRRHTFPSPSVSCRLPHVSIGTTLTLLVVFADDDQLCCQGALEVLLHLPAVVLGRLEAHEDGSDGLGGVDRVEDGVGNVVPKERGGHSVAEGGATVQGGSWDALVAVSGRRVGAVQLFVVHADVIPERYVVLWGVA